MKANAATLKSGPTARSRAWPLFIERIAACPARGEYSLISHGVA